MLTAKCGIVLYTNNDVINVPEQFTYHWKTLNGTYLITVLCICCIGIFDQVLEDLEAKLTICYTEVSFYFWFGIFFSNEILIIKDIACKYVTRNVKI